MPKFSSEMGPAFRGQLPQRNVMEGKHVIDYPSQLMLGVVPRSPSGYQLEAVFSKVGGIILQHLAFVATPRIWTPSYLSLPLIPVQQQHCTARAITLHCACNNTALRVQ
jgi:hypothetical protein